MSTDRTITTSRFASNTLGNSGKDRIELYISPRGLECMLFTIVFVIYIIVMATDRGVRICQTKMLMKVNLLGFETTIHQIQ